MKHLDTVRTIISDEYFMVTVNCNRVGEVDVRTFKVMLQCSKFIIYQSPHHLITMKHWKSIFKSEQENEVRSIIMSENHALPCFREL